MVAIASAEQPSLIRLHYLWYVAAALAVMVVAILSGDRWFLNFVHVFAGLMWTGIDVFMGFIVGPVLRRLDMPVRRAFVTGLVPRTLFLMPTLAIVTGTTGWFLAGLVGYLDVPWPEFAWVAAALAILAVLTVQGLGILLPTNLKVCLELQKPNPDMERIGRLMRRYFYVVASQGTLQIVMIVIMARFVTGL
ncbi:MAG TPA: hypothetical protein VHG92_03085 [Afifellaceae bacterium]|nr:hypothetical protein [Afifellaceae bacterium]